MSNKSGTNGVDLEDDSTSNQPAKDRRLRPTKYLPTERIKFTRQLELLRAFAAASGPTNKPAIVNEVAKYLNMVPSTVSMSNAFFVDVGFLQKSESGFTPAQEVHNYARAYEWNPDTAPQKLAPLLEQAWFMQSLSGRLAFRPLKEDDAIAILAEASSAGPDYKNQLVLLLDYLSAVGLISRENGEIRLMKNQSTPPTAKATDDSATKVPEVSNTPARVQTFASNASQFTGGAVQFHVSVKVDMAEFADWEPARIQAFFAGIAQVLAAKKALVGSNENID